MIALVAGIITAPMMSGTEPTYAFAFGVGVFGYQAAPILSVLLAAFIASLFVAKATVGQKSIETIGETEEPFGS